MITEHFQLIEKFLEFVRSFESDPDFEDTLEGISVEDLSMDGIKYHVESALEAEELFDDDPEKVKLLEELSEMLDFIEGEDLYRSPDAQFEDLGFKKKIMRPIPTVFHTLVVFEKKTKNGMRHILFMKNRTTKGYTTRHLQATRKTTSREPCIRPSTPRWQSSTARIGTNSKKTGERDRCFRRVTIKGWRGPLKNKDGIMDNKATDFETLKSQHQDFLKSSEEKIKQLEEGINITDQNIEDKKETIEDLKQKLQWARKEKKQWEANQRERKEKLKTLKKEHRTAQQALNALNKATQTKGKK